MANLEFLNKEKITVGFGEDLSGVTNYEDLIHTAGLDWEVEARPVYYKNDQGFFVEVPGAKEVVRKVDGKAMGTVTDRYKIVQNQDAFRFVENLFDQNVQFIRGGSFRGGKSTWLEAKLPENYKILGDDVDQYLVFKNSHDGKGSILAMIVLHRVVCSNALNYALSTASRVWRCMHASTVDDRLEEARNILLHTNTYMAALAEEAESLQKRAFTNTEMANMVNILLPYGKQATERQRATVDDNRNKLMMVLNNKEDIQQYGNTAYKFLNAVSDFATHAESKRNTATRNERLFESIIEGNPLIDRAYQLVRV